MRLASSEAFLFVGRFALDGILPAPFRYTIQIQLLGDNPCPHSRLHLLISVNSVHSVLRPPMPRLTLTHLESTPTKWPATIDSKQLAKKLSLLEATLTKKPGEGVAVMVN